MHESKLNDIRKKVDAILTRRRELLSDVERELRTTRQRTKDLKELLGLLEELRSLEDSAEIQSNIDEALKDIRQLHRSSESQSKTLQSLKARFSRETVNFGVSGEARVGKSTTLQKLTGLTDVEIPTGNGLPVTAVRSEIFNSTKSYAEITFRDEHSFLQEYLKPLLKVITNRLPAASEVDSINGFRELSLPRTLGENIDSVTTDALNRLREAQRSIDTYLQLLTGQSVQVDLRDLRKYVAYPTNDEIRMEEQNGSPISREYVAVKSVKIYCPFPQLPQVRIGLVDLPGLGEISDSVAEMHLRALENDIDQIFPILRPTESEGFIKRSIAMNIDHLRMIQPGILRRGDLITAGMNTYDGLTTTIQTLEDDFERQINGAQNEDRIELLRYCATDTKSTTEVFDKLLEKVARRLPDMDHQALDHAINPNRNPHLSTLDLAMRKALTRIPSPDRILNQQIDKVCQSLVHAYNSYEDELVAAYERRGDWREKFDSQVEDLHREITLRLEDGFFLGASTWEQFTLGHKDYYNLYRDECKRIRREMIACYSRLDSFYEDRLAALKLQATKIFLDNTGDLRKKFHLRESDSPEARIDRIRSELSQTIMDADLDSAFALLGRAQFSFHNNVFLQISEHLDELANPPENNGIGNIRLDLGSKESIGRKIENLNRHLMRIAISTNSNIRNALLTHNDRFNEYLAICISFFLDHLYRKDFENFKHVVIRGLINQYKDCTLADSTLRTLAKKRELASRIKGTFEALQKPRTAKRNGDQRNNLAIGRVTKGRVKTIGKYGTFIDIGTHRDGLIPRKLVGSPLQVNDIVEVEIIDITPDGKITLRLHG